MMSDEEKKAIKGLEWSQQQMRLGNLPDYDQGHYADIKIVLNLIEKQQKEIEELKTTKKELTERVLRLESDKFWDNVVSKDKIKAKIEELEKLDFGTDLVSQFTANLTTITILQSLLEKE